MKRAFDLLSSTILLLVFSPVLVTLYILVRIKLGKPALFRQTRPGYLGKPFLLYKFRSMTDAKDANNVLRSDAERLTAFGKKLRSTSLDELPSLINVLKGEMSLVGPRPLLMQYLDRYTPEQAMRHNVLPGITGWAQIKGRNAIDWNKKFELDVWYVKNRSFLLDIKILFMTVKKVIFKKDISANQHETMPEFLGERHDQ